VLLVAGTGLGGCRAVDRPARVDVTLAGVQLPVEWSLQVESEAGWQAFPLYVTDQYETEVDRFNVVHPAAPQPYGALRILLEPRPDAAVGLLEARLVFEDGAGTGSDPLKAGR
jgi:hypothetical protein